MRVQAIAVRIVALIVLISSLFDYIAYDMYDPSALMSSAGSEAFVTSIVPHRLTSVEARTTDLPDDQCLCCSPTIAPPRPVFEMPDLIACVVQTGLAALPCSEPVTIERPPRA
jgi:hypothetical protein